MKTMKIRAKEIGYLSILLIYFINCSSQNIEYKKAKHDFVKGMFTIRHQGESQQYSYHSWDEFVNGTQDIIPIVTETDTNIDKDKKCMTDIELDIEFKEEEQTIRFLVKAACPCKDTRTRSERLRVLAMNAFFCEN